MNRIEDKIVANFHKWMQNTYPLAHNLHYHIPNGGLRSKVEAVTLQAMGVLSGIPDYHIVIPSGRYLTLYIEFKRPGKITTSGDHAKKQQTVGIALRAAGHRVEVCDNLEQAQVVVSGYLTGTYWGQSAEFDKEKKCWVPIVN
jgi:hypothetical protein